jgi:2-polyprenyl-6-methoxyphenol hydroxylase-like FAD-dependent oxidoreductase
MRRPGGILVVGAGPAGLTTALQAHDHGSDVRIIDRRPEAFRPSRALIMHARSLEVLRPLGVTGSLLARADVAPTIRLRLGSRLVPVPLDGLRLPDTAFPPLTLIRQMDIETTLAEALAARGVEVERGTELTEVQEVQGGVQAVLRSHGKVQDAVFDRLVGCDGPASVVRAQAGIGWPGRAYHAEVVLADVELDADPCGGAQVVAGRHGLVFLFPLGELATWRLLATRPGGPDPLPFGQLGPPVPCAELQGLLDQADLIGQVTEVAWSARVRVQHRVAERFHLGRLYLAGDAAHAYSPATGQGMNAAIQDAANLGWKLAFAASGPADAQVFDSYDLERRPVARQVLAMTHLAFWGEAATGRLPSLLRGKIAPLTAQVLPRLPDRGRCLVDVARLVSQLRVSYRASPLSVEGMPRCRGRPRAGDRLPDATVLCGGRSVRLHALLARPGVHVLLARDADQIENLSLGPLVTLHRLTGKPGRGLLAIRPDGYVGLRCKNADANQLSAWLDLVRGGRDGVSRQPEM